MFIYVKEFQVILANTSLAIINFKNLICEKYYYAIYLIVWISNIYLTNQVLNLLNILF